MNKPKIFLILSLSFIGGIFGRSFFEINPISLYFLVLAAVIIAAVFWPRHYSDSISLSDGNNDITEKSKKNKSALVISSAVFIFAFSAWLTSSKLEKIANLSLDGKELSEKVIVAKEPIAKDNYQNVIVKTAGGLKILLNANLYQKLNYGDELALKCALKIPSNDIEGFNYQMYLAKDGIFYLCQNASFQKNGENKGNKIYLAILRLKNKMVENINQVIPEPEASLGNGLIFGGTSSLTKEVSNNFSKTGLSHIVAVSGYNVTIIAEYLMILGIFLGLWRKKAFWFAIVGIFIFVLAVGFPSSAIRAGVMGSLLLWAMKNGRLANSFNAIIFSAAVMLLLNPLLLRWDIGFQLSFLATLGIVELSPFWENYIIKKHKAFGILENVFLTLSATIFVVPIIMYNFHTLSLVSLLANFLVLSVVPLSMLLVFLTAFAGLLWGPLSLPFAWVTFLPLKYIIELVNYLSGLSWASKEVNNFGVGWLIVWYIILFSGVFLVKLKMRMLYTIVRPDDSVKDDV